MLIAGAVQLGKVRMCAHDLSRAQARAELPAGRRRPPAAPAPALATGFYCYAAQGWKQDDIRVPLDRMKTMLCKAMNQ